MRAYWQQSLRTEASGLGTHDRRERTGPGFILAERTSGVHYPAEFDDLRQGPQLPAPSGVAARLGRLERTWAENARWLPDDAKEEERQQ